MTLLHFLGIAVVLYLVVFVALLMTAGLRCDYCNKRIDERADVMYGANVCEECRERLFGL